MIFIFGIDRYKIKLVEMKAALEIKNSVVRSGNKIPMWYVEERDELVAEIAKLQAIIDIKESGKTSLPTFKRH